MSNKKRSIKSFLSFLLLYQIKDDVGGASAVLSIIVEHLRKTGRVTPDQVISFTTLEEKGDENSASGRSKEFQWIKEETTLWDVITCLMKSRIRIQEILACFSREKDKMPPDVKKEFAKEKVVLVERIKTEEQKICKYFPEFKEIF